MQVEKFEDLIAWQKSRVLTKAIYQTTQQPSFKGDYALCSQLQRAAVSVMSNIAEGFERNSAADFHRFLVMAKASCAEVRSQLYVALDIGYLSQQEFETLMQQAAEVGRIIGGLKSSVEKRK
ncbi:MAG: four helix bundle protein [Anaerolineae bacterium]|nr:four helix bundle protein [Anaerolineae bacterium]